MFVVARQDLAKQMGVDPPIECCQQRLNEIAAVSHANHSSMKIPATEIGLTELFAQELR